jgi:anaerobic glycerol-3-phosphate dehydrogenase
MPERAFLSKTEHSYIDVILKDGTYHYFTPRVLGILLETNRVHKFKRAGGWVTVGDDPIRSKNTRSSSSRLHGAERRTDVH